jgi:putative transposase
VVRQDVTDLRASELQQEVLNLRRRVKKFTALLRLALALFRSSGFTLAHERLPDGRAKIRILSAVDRARAYVPLRALLRFLRLSPSRFHAWRRRQHPCALDDHSSCPHVAPSTDPIRSPDDQGHGDRARVPAGPDRHARHPGAAARQGLGFSLDLVSPRAKVRLASPPAPRAPGEAKGGPSNNARRPDAPIDTTVIRLLDGTRVYLHGVIDNFSRRILAWRFAETFAPVNSVAVLVEAGRGAMPSETTPVVLADAGVENVNAEVDALLATGVLRRVLAFTELKFSNSLIEAWWRSLKHQWLFLHSLDSVTTVRRLVAFYVQEHNRVLPHSAFRGQTPDEMYFGTGDTVPADLTSRAAAARRARAEANRSAACRTRPSVDAAA